MNQEQIPNIRTVDPRKVNLYINSTGLWKKQGFISFPTPYGNALSVSQISVIFGYHKVPGLHYIFNEEGGKWEIWGPTLAIEMLKEKIKPPEQRRVEQVRASVSRTIGNSGNQPPSGGTKIIIG